MDVIFDATNGLGNRPQPANCASQLLAQTRAPLGANERTSFLCAENKVMVNAPKSRPHGITRFWHLSKVPGS
jgi:hypothetical protein